MLVNKRVATSYGFIYTPVYLIGVFFIDKNLFFRQIKASGVAHSYKEYDIKKI